jgi:hypothetical protein
VLRGVGWAPHCELSASQSVSQGKLLLLRCADTLAGGARFLATKVILDSAIMGSVYVIGEAPAVDGIAAP